MTAVGAARLSEIMAELAELATTVVQLYGGIVDKFTGDGIVTLFGAQSRWRITHFAHAWRRCVFRTVDSITA